MKLSPCIHQFFDQYLPHIKGVSHHTVKAYRDAFRLFLPFAARFYGIKIRSLRVEHLSSALIIAFLEDLQKERKNLVKTRNQRLAAPQVLCQNASVQVPGTAGDGGYHPQHPPETVSEAPHRVSLPG